MSVDEKKKRLGELLVEWGLISDEDLKKALNNQKQSGTRLGELLVKEGFLTENDLINALEQQLGIQSVDLSKFFIDPEAVKLIPESLCRKYTMIGIEISNGQLLLAMKDPMDYFALEDIKLLIPIQVKQVISYEKDILEAIDRFFSKKTAEKAVEDFVSQKFSAHSKRTVLETDNSEDIKNAPIVRFINSIIENAILNNASDIHIGPEEDDVRVRLRIDGILQDSMRINFETLNAIVGRIKIMSNLNIAEKRIPQDGRISYFIDGRGIDIRVSTLPTIYGEKIVMRILDKSKFVLSKMELGLSEEDSKKFDKLIEKPYGIILSTGPTGSGKTSTLYAILSELNDSKKNIITIEDPVEYNLKGVSQVQLNTKAGLTFASGLRAILRQDPDIVMVGEIRDGETAEIAVRSALTGHLVLSTLHTNDAPGAISRLIDIGIEPFLISSSVIGIIAQRLVRKICPFCRKAYEPDERELRILGRTSLEVPSIYKGTGCKMCNSSGYKGRTAVFEIMELDKELRELIDRRASNDEIRDKALANGMCTLREACCNLVTKGVTTIDELVRVTYSY